MAIVRRTLVQVFSTCGDAMPNDDAKKEKDMRIV